MARSFADRLKRRGRFVTDSARLGWGWLISVGSHVGAAFVVLLILGVGTVSYRVSNWWLLALTATVLVLVVFAEGAYRVWSKVNAELLGTQSGEYTRLQFEALHRRGKEQRDLLLSALRRRSQPAEVLAKERPVVLRDWQSEVLALLAVHAPDRQFRFEDDSGFGPPAAHVGTTMEESDLINEFDRRLARLSEIIDGMRLSP
jgi:hypothetical protein